MFEIVASTCHTGLELNQPSEEALLAFLPLVRLHVGNTLTLDVYSQLPLDMACYPSCRVLLRVKHTSNMFDVGTEALIW